TSFTRGVYTIGQEVKKIVVAAGAGISTAAGIPDFRTPGTGLYDNLQKYDLPEPEDIFCLEYFAENPKPFFHLAKELYPGTFKPTRTHFFLTLLSRRSLLHTLLTQNIDTLETLAGVPAHKIVHAHGSFATASCTSCRASHPPDHVRRAIFASLVPECTQCSQGVVKPDIVFFGEALPEAFFKAMQSQVPEADLLLVLGTSLKVAPFNMVVDEVGVRVPRVLINRERVGECKHPGRGLDFDGKYQKFRRDVFVGESCDDAIEQLVERLGWTKDLDEVEREWELAAALEKVKL
ncbi:DHS-like NAD/FAD-binding domain-containing protein, partial [Catenaria anguillulae PL171]